MNAKKNPTPWGEARRAGGARGVQIVLRCQPPASVHEAVARARDTLHRIEEHGQPVLPDEVFQEANRLTCWMDCEGMARRIHTLLSMLEVQVAELDDVPDVIFTLLLAANEQAAQLADAILAVEALEWALKKHEIEQARAEATAKNKPATKRRQQRQGVET